MAIVKEKCANCLSYRLDRIDYVPFFQYVPSSCLNGHKITDKTLREGCEDFEPTKMAKIEAIEAMFSEAVKFIKKSRR